MVPELALKALQHYYGYPSFRAAQEPVVENLLRGRDTLAIMPTGAGKSVCFQIPAVLRKGLTIVFTPLISLMKDQVDGLQEQQIPATYLNSTLDPKELNKRYYDIRMGRVKLLYIAPERLDAEGFRNFLLQTPIAQVIIDEAHCVSQWGHDFRPSYCKIAPFIQSLPKKPIVGAFTATATKEVEADMRKLLQLEAADVFVTGFNRPNLRFEVVHGAKKIPFLLHYVKRHANESGVIYCATRKAVEQVYGELVKAGVKAGYYHAGLSDEIRKKEQEKYAFDEVDVMVATNAFGMGIDKSNVRYVLHYQMPRNMEGYYQEAGRAGRDGAPAECILLYSGQDVQIQKFLIEKYSESEERKEQELRRLEDMTDYCFTTDCLRKYILRYFGEQVPWQHCHHCSACDAKETSEDATKEAFAVLQAMEYTEERYGSGMITDILRGADTERIRQYGYDRSPVYGLLADMSAKELKHLLQTLVAGNYIENTTGQYPLLRMLPAGEEVLAGRARVVWNKPVVAKAVTRPMEKEEKNRNTLFDRLRQVRKELAQEVKLPPYLIFADTALIEMVRVMPLTEEEMLTVKGVGDIKMARYGSQFLQVIQEYVNAECKEEA